MIEGPLSIREIAHKKGWSRYIAGYEDAKSNWSDISPSDHDDIVLTLITSDLSHDVAGHTSDGMYVSVQALGRYS